MSKLVSPELQNISSLDVFFHDKLVGTLANTSNHFVAFAYSDDWLAHGFSINPYSLPLEKKVFIPKKDTLNGLFGVFSDSLPDGWGTLLVDRFLSKHGINPHRASALFRLTVVGDDGMGALTYRPTHNITMGPTHIDLDELNLACKSMLESNTSANVIDSSKHLDELFALGGSSGGARPKILTTIDDKPWIIKFPSSSDPANIGKQEYDYAMCAKACGIIMPQIKLHHSNICDGFFGIERFDRKPNQKIHMVSASGLLETSHRYPNLDYHILMKLCRQLTRDHSQVIQLFRLMCFNVFAHNQDDHGKNFSFLFNHEEGCWMLSPAYDLTFSTSFGGEHATTINGNGNPAKDDILEVARKADIRKREAEEIMNSIEAIVKETLHQYLC